MVFKRLAKDSAIYGGADFLGKFISFFTFPIIAAALSPLAFGVLELINTTTGLLGLLMNCGMNNAVQRYYWSGETTTEEQRADIVSSGFASQVVLGAIMFLVLMTSLPLFLHQVQQQQLPVGWLGLVSASCLMVLSQWVQFFLDVLRLHLAPFKFLILTLLSRVLGILLALLVIVQFHGGVDGFLTLQASVALLILPLAVWLTRKDLTPKIKISTIRELISYGYPFIFVGLAYWLFGSMDRWMLASMSSVSEAGIYSVSFKFASILFFLSTAFGQAWSPIAIKMCTDYPETYRKLYAQILLLLLFVMLIVGCTLSLFSGEFIKLFMPSEYESSALPLSILCFGIILQSTQQITAIGIALEKQTHIFAYTSWITAIINLTLNWLLIPQYGATGAAWATTISYLALTSIFLYFTQKLHPLPISWYKLFILLFVGILLGSASLYLRSYSFDPVVIIFKLGLILISLITGWSILPVRKIKYG